MAKTRYFKLLSQNVEYILDALPVGVFISDSSGVSLRVNRMYEQLTGLTQQQIEGKNVRDLVEEGIFDCILNSEIVQTGRTATRVQKLRNGKKLVLMGFPVFDVNGSVCLVVTFARDVTLLDMLQNQVAEQSRLIAQTTDQLAYMTREGKRDEPVYTSRSISKVVELLQRFAQTDATVLILGETGVGKDIFARYTHTLSARRDKILLKVDCGGISEALTESELFGYMPGAFTGASSKGKVGYFEIADGGTIFLDEVGELPLSMQTRLLRVLQDNEIVRVGSSNPKKVNVRVIAATNRDLAESVKKGTFRSDLFYRLNVATVYIPPLRERREDVRVLAQHFLTQYASKYHKTMSFMETTLDMLLAYDWPGNVRELQNLIHMLVITLNYPLISPSELPAHISGVNRHNEFYSEENLNGSRPLHDIMAEMEYNFLVRAVQKHGSIKRVAQLFNVNRSTIFRKLKNHM